MKFRKFTVFNSKPTAGQEGDEIEVLFNLDHIISIKPIRIARSDKLLNGFWIRTTNGKKYRASKIPDDLLVEIGEKYQGIINMYSDADEQSYQ